MPLHGIDHIELWVGNAAQAAYYLRHAFGFTEVAFAGLETGLRDRVSHVLQQGRIRLVLTGTLRDGTEIGAHQRVTATASRSSRCRCRRPTRAYREAVARGATGVREPYELRDEHGVVRIAEIAAYGETVHTLRRARRLRRAVPAGVRRACAHAGDASQPGLLAGHRPRRGQRRARRDGAVGEVLRGRLRDDRAHPLLRRGDLDGVLGAHVEGRDERRRAGEAADQRAGRGRAQVADRRVPRVLRRARACSTSRSPRRTSCGPSRRWRRAG